MSSVKREGSPHCGMAAARVAAAELQEVEMVMNSLGTQLEELPTLSIPAGEPWERNHSFMNWIRE
eukprot:4086022-Prorocentrum_lima.AAC.1